MVKINPLYGSLFSFKHHISSLLALRFGIDPVYLNQKSTTLTSDTSEASTTNREYLYQKGVGANFDLLIYLKNSSEIKFYLGAGPGLFIKKRKGFHNKNEFKAYTLHCFAGVEWWVTHNFSVGLEYILQFEKTINQWQIDTIVQQGSQDIPTKIFKEQQFNGIKQMPIHLILSLYF